MSNIIEFDNFPNESIFQMLISNYQPFFIKNHRIFNDSQDIFEILMQLDDYDFKTVDVSCINSNDSILYGNAYDREKVDIKLSVFLDFFKSPKQHWLKDSNLNLYLSQFDIKDYLLDDVNSNMYCPEILKSESLIGINLWMNIYKITSSSHYDENHNLLHVVKGSKRVYLLSPEHINSSLLFPVHSMSSNHLKPIHQDIKDNFQTIVINMSEGTSLFIPEGWIHMVDSIEDTIAVNYWFRSKFYQTITSNKHMNEYFFRNLVQVTLEKECNAMFTTIYDSNKCLYESYDSFEDYLFFYFEKFINNIKSTHKRKISNKDSYHTFDKLSKLEFENAIFRCSKIDMIKYWPLFSKNVCFSPSKTIVINLFRI